MRVVDSVEPEAAIRQVLDGWTSALRARDLEGMMSYYTPDVVFYDGIGPLQIGPEAYKRNWSEYFNMFSGPVGWDTHDLRITAGDRAAFSCGLVQLRGMTAEGKDEGAWMRQTIGFEKIGDTWRITHEHWSMPMDMETGKVATTLTPE